MPGFGAKAIESPQRLVNILSLRKTGGGTPALGGLCASFCTITDNGTGDYTITVNRQAPFSQVVQAFVQLHDVGFAVLDIASPSALSITVNTFDTDGTTPADIDFDLLVVGSHARDLVGI